MLIAELGGNFDDDMARLDEEEDIKSGENFPHFAHSGSTPTFTFHFQPG